MKQKTTKKSPVWFTVLFIALIIYGGCKLFNAVNSPDNGTKDHSSMAYIISQDYIKQRLNYPKEADFPYMPVSSKMVRDSVYSVIGDVTTKNGFGVKVGVRYHCVLKFIGGDDVDNNNWELVDLQMK